MHDVMLLFEVKLWKYVTVSKRNIGFMMIFFLRNMTPKFWSAMPL